MEWFENTFPYFKDGNYALDKDGFIVDSTNLTSEIKMVQEVKKANPSYMNGTMNVTELARLCELSRPTIYKYLELIK